MGRASGSARRLSGLGNLNCTAKGAFLTLTHRLQASYMADGKTPLDHVDGLYAIVGYDGQCHGDGNRLFLSMDDYLWYAMAYANMGYVTTLDQNGNNYWTQSNDLAGPHDPFDGSNMTSYGHPRPPLLTAAADRGSSPRRKSSQGRQRMPSISRFSRPRYRRRHRRLLHLVDHHHRLVRIAGDDLPQPLGPGRVEPMDVRSQQIDPKRVRVRLAEPRRLARAEGRSSEPGDLGRNRRTVAIFPSFLAVASPDCRRSGVSDCKGHFLTLWRSRPPRGGRLAYNGGLVANRGADAAYPNAAPSPPGLPGSCHEWNRDR